MELVSLRAQVVIYMLPTGDAYRVKLRMERSTTTGAAEEEIEQPTASLGTAFDESGRQLAGASHLA